MNMQLGLTPPLTTRVIWHSEAQRKAGEEALQEIGREWPFVERLSVARGIRPVTRQVLKRGLEFDRVEAWARNEGLCVEIWMAVGEFAGFAHHYPAGDSAYVTVIASSKEALQDHEKFLGYPACCQEAFARWFPGSVDPMWQWAGEREAVRASPYSNPLLRYVNARFAPHIPCEPNCEASIELGRLMRALMKPENAARLQALLEAPTEWDCYRGLAVVTLPDFRVLIGSNPTSTRYRVKANYGQPRFVALSSAH
jgi:hypothetical protein